MPLRTKVTVIFLIGLASASLLVCYLFWLPALSAFPKHVTFVPLPPWSWLVPLAAGLPCLVFVLWQSRTPGDYILPLQQGTAGHLPTPLLAARLGNLSSQATLFFLLGGGIALPLIILLDPDPLIQLRPLTPCLGAPALLLAHAILLRMLIQGPLLEATRMALGSGGTNLPLAPPANAPGTSQLSQLQPAIHALQRSNWAEGWGVLALRSTMMINALILTGLALALIAVYTSSHNRAQQEKQTEAHLHHLLSIVRSQLRYLPAAQIQHFLANYPFSAKGTPLLVNGQGRTMTEGPGHPTGTAFSTHHETCRLGNRPFRCATQLLPGGQRLAVLQARPPVDETIINVLSSPLLPLGFGILLFSGLLSWFWGREFARDLKAMTNQLNLMAEQDELDLDRPVTVTSIDELGDLTASLGQLRHHLEEELESYRESLRKTREADRLKNKFFADVSHELRTPLTSICGLSQLLVEGFGTPLPPEQKEDVEVIFHSGQHLLGLINHVIDLSVIEAGQLTLNLEKVDLRSLCLEVIRSQTAYAKAKHGLAKKVALVTELEEDLPLLIGDPLRLREVMSNLISNALKFTEAGQVTVAARRGDAEQLVVEVRDTGIGISATELPRIFERYHQSGTKRMKREGSGLGLAICNHLVDLHGGSISVASMLGQGTTVTIWLPLCGPERRKKTGP